MARAQRPQPSNQGRKNSLRTLVHLTRTWELTRVGAGCSRQSVTFFWGLFLLTQRKTAAGARAQPQRPKTAHLPSLSKLVETGRGATHAREDPAKESSGKRHTLRI